MPWVIWNPKPTGFNKSAQFIGFLEEMSLILRSTVCVSFIFPLRFCMYLYCCWGICLQCGQLSKEPPSRYWNPLLNAQGPLWNRQLYNIVKAGHKWWNVAGGHEENPQLTPALDPSHPRLLTPSADLGMSIPLAFCAPIGCTTDM